jgi:hypothetical protein
LEDIDGLEVEHHEWCDAPILAARSKGVKSSKMDIDPLGGDAAGVYVEWLKEVHKREQENLYGEYDAYIIDSTSSLMQLLLRRTLAIDGRAGRTPDRSDFIPVTDVLGNIATRMCNKNVVGCHFILCAHEEPDKCELTGKITVRPLLPGRLKGTISNIFSEVYHCEAREGPQGPEYVVQTAPSGMYPKASTRMGKGGKLAFKEVVTIDWNKPFRQQGIAALARKCGVEM